MSAWAAEVHMQTTQQTHYAIMTSLLRQNDVIWRNHVKMTSFWRYNGVITVMCSLGINGRSVISLDTPAPTAKVRITCVTSTFDLLTWKWYTTHRPLTSRFWATYEYRPWNSQRATGWIRHGRPMGVVKPIYPAQLRCAEVLLIWTMVQGWYMKRTPSGSEICSLLLYIMYGRIIICKFGTVKSDFLLISCIYSCFCTLP